MKDDDLAKTIDTMDVPALRKELTTTNVRWLLRNLRVRNANHPHIVDVIDALKELVNESRNN